MKTLNKMDRKVLLVVAAILAALMLGCLTACAMQKAGALEESEIVAGEEVAGSFADDVATEVESDDGAEAAAEEGSEPATESDDSTEQSQEEAGDAKGSTTAVQGHESVVTAPTSQVATSGGHTHIWEPVKTPHEVTDVDAYYETQYRTEERVMCSACGEDITNGDKQGRSILQHGKAHTLAGEGGGTYSSTKKVPCGTIYHPAQTHIEYEITGYQCSCGATK